ncbi:MAG: LysR family transcriptional regulator [Polaromonas sp.]|uniref:LysR family transcriptional regulator n=1 Tax=Polaromonas sp. TaxID=1869339 RepID=UPI0018059968|nr:LysR family transcriptional regulator [Polaromonas sp.]MBA3595007.1 LysR family transcriptional regulator [Polaromonas sp.]
MNPKPDRLSGIEDFVAAVDAGSFALAARRRQLTRSAVAKSIARLEARLGVRLFLRTTRSQSLTEDGQAYYERCQRVFAELDAADASMDAARQTPAGRVRLSMPVLFGRMCVGPLLLELARLHPQLALEASFSDRYSDLVDEGLDLVLRSGPLRDSATHVARRVGMQRMVVCAAPAYLAEQGWPRSVDELAGHQAIVYGRGGRVKPWEFNDTRGQRVEVAVGSRFCFDDLQMMASAAHAGVGLTRLPVWLVADALREGTLVQLFDEPFPFGYELHVVWPHTRYLPLKTRVVVDLLLEKLPPLLAA